jgi:predicted acetyltransferase
MTVTLHDATPADLPAVKNLVPYYIYGMSEYLGWPCTADGRFDGCDDLASYWTTPGRHAFVLRHGDELAGFALILADNAEANVDYSVTDFFVLRKFRRRGVGERIARELFDRFRGRWKIDQFVKNTPAVAFWSNAVERYCKGQFEQRDGNSEWGALNTLLFRSDSAEP